MNDMDEEYKGYSIKIERDNDPQDPREWDNLGDMLCLHGRYKLGDKHSFRDATEIRQHIVEEKAISLPLFLYDHSGITMSTKPFSCPWDSGQVGVIIATESKIKKEFDCNKITAEIKEKVIKCLVSEVETYDKYIRGESYVFFIEGPEFNMSVCGYDDIKYAIEEAKSEIDAFLSNRIPLDKWENIAIAL